MDILVRFFEFMNTSFSVWGFTLSFWQVLVFGVLCDLVGYFVGTWFRR